MPRYYYNVFGETSVLDDQGVEFSDIGQARAEAVRYAASFIYEDACKNVHATNWCVQVSDAEGAILFRLDFVITIQPVKAEPK